MIATLRARAREIAVDLAGDTGLDDAIESVLLRFGAECLRAEPDEKMTRSASIEILPSYAGQLDHQHAYDIVSHDDMVTLFRAMAAERAKGLTGAQSAE